MVSRSIAARTGMTDICLNSLLDRDNGKNIPLRNFLNIDARRLLARS
jgi:hypothetical protein